MIKTRGWSNQEITLLVVALIIVLIVILYPLISSGEVKSGRGRQAYDIYSRKWNVTPFLAIWGWIMLMVILFFPIFYFRYHQTNVTFKPHWSLVIGSIILGILVFVLLGGYVWSDPIEHFAPQTDKPMIWVGLSNTDVNGNIESDQYTGSNRTQYEYNQTYVDALIRLFSSLKEGKSQIFDANNLANRDELNNLIAIVQQANRDRIPLLIPGNLTGGNTTGARTAQWNQWSQFKQTYIDNPVLNNIFQIYETLGPQDRETPDQFLQNDDAGLTWLNARNKRRYHTILTDENGNYLALNNQNGVTLYLIVINGALQGGNLDFLKRSVNAIGDNWFLISCNTPFEEATQEQVRAVLQSTQAKFLGCYNGQYQGINIGMKFLFSDFLNYPSPKAIRDNQYQSITIYVKPTAGTNLNTKAYNISWPVQPWAAEANMPATPFFVQLANTTTENCTDVQNAVENSPFKFTSIDNNDKIVYVSKTLNKMDDWRVIKSGNDLSVQKFRSGQWTAQTGSDCTKEVTPYQITEPLSGSPVCSNLLDQLFARNLFYTDSPNLMKVRATTAGGTLVQFIKITISLVRNNITQDVPFVRVQIPPGVDQTNTNCQREITNVRQVTPSEQPFTFRFEQIQENQGRTRDYFEIVGNTSRATTDKSLTALAARLGGNTFWSTAANRTNFGNFPHVLLAEDFRDATNDDAAKNILSKYIQVFFIKFTQNNPQEKVNLAETFPGVINKVERNLDFNFGSQSLGVTPYIISFQPGSSSELAKKWLSTWWAKRNEFMDVYTLAAEPKTNFSESVPLRSFLS